MASVASSFVDAACRINRYDEHCSSPNRMSMEGAVLRRRVTCGEYKIVRARRYKQQCSGSAWRSSPTGASLIMDGVVARAEIQLAGDVSGAS
jgi:hypothetical protein